MSTLSGKQRTRAYLGVRHQIAIVLSLCVFPCFVPRSADAQLLSAGIKGGVPLNEAFLFTSRDTGPGPVATRASYFARTKRYIVGPSVQVNLPLRLAIEIDILYRRLNYDNNFYTRSPSSGELFINTYNVANKWEFPLLLKYRLPGTALRPFVAAGVSVNRISGTGQIREAGGRQFSEWSYSRMVRPADFRLEELARSSTGGFVLGGGVEIPIGFARISGELRYTRWAQENFREPETQFGIRLRSNLNQADFLLGISF
jgi:hypothetical protein